jgi:hypothetical protein
MVCEQVVLAGSFYYQALPTFSLYTSGKMSKPAPKKSVLPPARVGLLVIVVGATAYAALTLLG